VTLAHADVLAQNLLQIAVDAIPATPKIQRVVHGAPAYELANQMTVNLSRWSASQTSTPLSSPTTMRPGAGAQARMDFLVTWLRCWPADDPPNWRKIEETATLLLTEADLIYRALMQTVLKRPFATAMGASKVLLGDMLPVQPQGGLAGWQTAVQVYA